MYLQKVWQGTPVGVPLVYVDKTGAGKANDFNHGRTSIDKIMVFAYNKNARDTTCVSVADTDNFGLGIMLWGHRRRGVYSPPFFFLGKTVMEELSIFH